ncbi:MAG TPA: T9SS type A sorting domain-containing protein [candidate division WOR-3 bacterium]|uniref:T9SS type A sorting domain-containing protein n=1 Tax=candidate division WOR-3 bacterium TaxID=2052148 RepID=A0A9C9EMH5_UNCW3|nr:T9SS type A sorting domain-containing protein [candidate division WOR-3 bacterium]
MKFLVLLGLVVMLQADVDTLNPVEDVYVVSYGGGEGGNPFLKFDISSIPSNAQIDSVILECYVWQVGYLWDADVIYWNVNSQTWTENDSAHIIWQIPTSDSTHQASGFGVDLGWARSVDLTDIFNRDYEVSHTFCTIKMKDPDDMTSVVPWGFMPHDSNDSLYVGLWDEWVFFYPHEHGSQIPRLIVYYAPIGIEEEITTPLQDWNSATVIYGSLQLPEGKKCKVYDISGRAINANKIKPGIYFIKIEGKISRKVVKI